jgi:hypothetical protein
MKEFLLSVLADIHRLGRPIWHAIQVVPSPASQSREVVEISVLKGGETMNAHVFSG